MLVTFQVAAVRMVAVATRSSSSSRRLVLLQGQRLSVLRLRTSTATSVDPLLSLHCPKLFSTRTNDIVSSSSTSKQEQASRANSCSQFKAYSELAKARLSALVVATTAAGFVAAGPIPLSTQPLAFTAVLTGTALCASSAAALNQIFEIGNDRRMKRTQQRPLVSGALTVPQAVLAAGIWGVSGTSILWYGTDPLTTTLGLSNIVLYAGIYTALKPVSVVNTWVGAVVGAVPPVMGYTAATAAALGSFSVCDSASLVLLCDPVLWTLGSTLYFWQLPHFMALSYMYRADYARGGFAMVPCRRHISNDDSATSSEIAAQQTADIIVRYAWYLTAVPIVSTVFDVTSSMFALEGMALNAYALKIAYNFRNDKSNANARKIFLTSLWYLPTFLMLFLLHSKTWDETEETREQQQQQQRAAWPGLRHLADHIHTIRKTGRELCLHEQQAAAFKRKGSSSGAVVAACPVVVGKEQGRETAATAAQVVTEATTEKIPVRLAITADANSTTSSDAATSTKDADD